MGADTADEEEGIVSEFIALSLHTHLSSQSGIFSVSSGTHGATKGSTAVEAGAVKTTQCCFSEQNEDHHTAG